MAEPPEPKEGPLLCPSEAPYEQSSCLPTLPRAAGMVRDNLRMGTSRSPRASWVLACLGLACISLWGAPAAAEDGAALPVDPAKDWRVTIAPYVWMTSLNGDATIAGINTDVDAVAMENMSVWGLPENVDKQDP